VSSLAFNETLDVEHFSLDLLVIYSPFTVIRNIHNSVGSSGTDSVVLGDHAVVFSGHACVVRYHSLALCIFVIAVSLK
jgi:hypothetical protein